MEISFSEMARRARQTEIIKILARSSKIPDFISFAIGIPAPETVPVETLKKIADEILEREGLRALQYSDTKGNIQKTLVDFLSKDNIRTQEDEIVVTTGAIQGTFLATLALCDPEDIIVSEFPVYPINLQTFRMHVRKIIPVSMDEEGMIVDELVEKVNSLDKKPKFIYTIPDFQNPSGITMSLERRKKLVEFALEKGIFILEDTPYRYMRYEGERLPSLKELGGDIVIHVNSFSKTISTGLRVGYVVAPRELAEKMVSIKQGADFSTPLLNQLMISYFLEKGLWEEQIERIRKIHTSRLRAVLKALKEHFPEEVTWTEPKGGTFIWVTLPGGTDIRALLDKALENKVGFVPSSDFYLPEIERDYPPAMRLNFPYYGEEKIDEGIKRLAKALRETLG